MDTATPQQGEGPRGSNLSYFLFLSMLFFFMSSGPDTSSEMHYKAALTRLTRERQEFKEWLYPGSTLLGNGTDNGELSTTRAQDTDTLTSTIKVAPSDGLDEGKNGTAGPDKDTEPFPKPFVLEDWTPLNTIRAEVDNLLRQQDDVHEPLYYRNISGFFKGTYITRTGVNVTDGSQNVTELKARQGRFPWTGKSAKKGASARVVRLNVRETVPHVKGMDPLDERQRAEAVIIRGSLDLELHSMIYNDTKEVESETQTTQLDMEGIHWIHNGTFFIHAAAPWHDLDMRQLPGLLLSNQTANETAQIVLKELDARIERIQTALNTGRYGDTSGSDGDSRLNCTFSMYGHLRSLPPNVPEARLREREEELRSPSGVSTLHLPPPTMDGILFSKDCNLLVQLDDMVGLELEDFWNKAITYSFILGAITLLQTWVLVKQMEYTTTPSAIGRVSHLTIAMQVMMDVYFCVTHLTLGVITGNKASKAFLVPGFFGILSGLLFGLRYAAIIRVSTYRPEPPTPAPVVPPTTGGLPTNEGDANTQSQAAEPRTSTDTANPNTSTPLLARPQAVQGVAPSTNENHWQGVMTVLGALAAVALFYFVGWFGLLVFGTYSFWVPQIYHNAERGSGRHALLKKYILVTACARLFIPLYIWACPVNLLFTDTSPWVYTLVVWQAIQVAVLFLQDKLGPRFFLPTGFWFEELDHWDYHPILLPQDIESGPVLGEEGTDEAKRLDLARKGEVECPICLSPIEIASPGGDRASLDVKTGEYASSGTSMGEVLGAARRGANRMTYMVPPCHHLMHTDCLEGWASQKMICPTCRRPLPPF